jgi:hypothetical protein
LRAFRSRSTRAGLAALVAVVGASLVYAPASSAATPPALGAAASTAAPSCWWIKQVNPSAADGIYWLQTPALVAPQQFYCDMTTDGGGYVLVGRGRDGWSFFPTGQRSAANILSAPNGTAAFAPAALPTDTINGLLNGGTVTGLDDGVLLKRAASFDGSSSQLVKWHLLHLNSWSWSFPGGQQLASADINGTTYVGGNTRDPLQTFDGQVGPGTGSANNSLRVFTYQWAQHNYSAGFGYGASVSGNNSPNSYLWTYQNEGAALPFTQVMIRPKLGPFTYTAIPDAGLAGTTQPPIMKSQVEPLSGWGVTGVTKVGDSEPQVDSGVLSFAQVGNTVFVGGKFTTVQQGAAGVGIAQPYIAAFDQATGAWISTFRPVLDGTVWHMAGTPDGHLIVAGQFTNVNGVAGTTALAELDPVTGAVVPTWRANLTPARNSTIRALARGLDIEGNWVYVGGLFSAITGPKGITRQESSLGRVSLATGEPDTAFRPVASNQVYAIDATPTRVYAAGYFDTMNGVYVQDVAVLNPADGSLVPGIQAWQPSNVRAYQQTILAVGNNVWQGGSEHSLQVYTAADYTPVKKFVTSNSGGDFQSLAEIDGFVYGSGHFSRFVYTDGALWPALTGFTRADKALFVGAWNENDYSYQTNFAPVLHSRNTEGIWALMGDSSHCLWFGGDLDQANTQWIGGFGKYCEVDHVAPTVPASATAKVTSGGIALSWAPSTDASGAVKYEILRNDRVIAGNYGVTTYTDPYGLPSDRYFVRAIDTAGNRSATTSLLQPTDTTAPSTPTGLAGGVNGTDVTLTWTPSTDNVGVTGYTVYRNGVSVGDVATNTTTISGLAAGTYAFQVQAFDAAGNRSSKSPSISQTIVGPDLTAPTVPKNLAATVNGADITLTWTPSTDNVGVIGYTVYRNGVSIGDVTDATITDPGRPAGTSTYQVLAFDAAGNKSAKTASVSAIVVGPDIVAPTVPKNLAGTVNGKDVTLTWTASTDNVGVAGYTVYRNGVSQGDVTVLTATLPGLATGTYSFQVQAFDAAGNRSGKTAPLSLAVP